MVYLNSAVLRDLLREGLVARGVEHAAAGHVADSLVETSLRGVDSHGVHLYPHYCRAVEGGRINARANIRTIRTAASAAIIDADHAFGHYAGAVAIDTAVGMARETGIGAVSVANSSHFGAAAYFALRAARSGYLGMAFCNADALVKVYNGRSSFFGTNPICFCAPLSGEEPFCLDMATSLAAWNKVKNARAVGSTIPQWWAFDEFGVGVTDPHRARSLAPLGGYKGFDLGMMVDILCALLANGPMSKDIPPMFDAPLSARRRISHFFLALDISKFVPLDVFMARLREMADRVRATPAMEDADDAVMVAGDPEKRCHAVRVVEGIPMAEERFGELLGVLPGAVAAQVSR